MKRYVLVAAVLVLAWSAFDESRTSTSHMDLAMGVRPALADDEDDSDAEDGGDDGDNGTDAAAEEESTADAADDFDEDDGGDGDNDDDDNDDDDDDDDDDGDDDDDEENGEEEEEEISSAPSDDDIGGATNSQAASESDLDDAARLNFVTIDTPVDDGVVEEGEILAFAPNAAPLDQIEALGYDVGARESLPALGIEVLQIVSDDDRPLEDVLTELRATVPDITFEANHIYNLAGAPCAGNGCYGTDLIGWSGDRATCGSGIRIGVIDSGVDMTEAALNSDQIRQRSFLSDRPAAPPDHGSAVAALLIANHDGTFAGLLPAAELLMANAFYQHADGAVRANALALARSLDWLVGEGVSVINVSLAGPANGLLELSVARATDVGAIIVAAAGNEGPSASPLYPGAYDDALAITAVDQYLRIYRHANRGKHLYAAAPGVRVWTPTGSEQGRVWDGTSFAAVFASAILAERAAREAQPGGVANAVSRDARDLGAPGRDNVYGWGLMASAPACLAAR